MIDFFNRSRVFWFLDPNVDKTISIFFVIAFAVFMTLTSPILNDSRALNLYDPLGKSILDGRLDIPDMVIHP
jgi:hypothetical protein